MTVWILYAKEKVNELMNELRDDAKILTRTNVNYMDDADIETRKARNKFMIEIKNWIRKITNDTERINEINTKFKIEAQMAKNKLMIEIKNWTCNFMDDSKRINDIMTKVNRMTEDEIEVVIMPDFYVDFMPQNMIEVAAQRRANALIDFENEIKALIDADAEVKFEIKDDHKHKTNNDHKRWNEIETIEQQGNDIINARKQWDELKAMAEEVEESVP
jgi:hypothetical protein